ncbi:hypothetical protein Tco_0914218 [Tanacetum coccineum]
MAELFLNKYTEKDQIESNLSITNTNNDMNIKLSKEFLTELQNNIYHRIHHEDVVDHIAMVLEMLDLINIPELVEKFFYKFYPESYDGEEEMLDEGNNWGIDPLEFLSRVNSSFEKYRKVDGRTKKDKRTMLKEKVNEAGRSANASIVIWKTRTSLKEEKSTMLVENLRSRNLEVLES